MATFQMDMPPALSGQNQDLQAMRSYIARLVDRLLYTLNHIDSENLVEGGVSIGKISGGSGAIAQAAVGEMWASQQGRITTQHITAQVAEIVTAVIQHAVVDWANLKHMVADTAIVADFVGEKMFIDHLAVRAAQMVQLAVGTLCIKAADGNYYTLDVDMDTGTVTAHQTTVTAAELEAGVLEDGGQHIIETDLTVAHLNASDIHAVTALLDEIQAARIDVDELTAREAFIQKITAGEIASRLGQTLNLSSNSSIQATVRQIAEAGDNEIKGTLSNIRQTMSDISLSVQRINNEGIGTKLILDENMVRIRQAGDWEQQLTAQEMRFVNRTTGTVAASFGVNGGYADRLQSYEKMSVGTAAGWYDMAMTTEGVADKWRGSAGKAIITQEPEDQRTTQGGSFTLTAAAENASGYQWQQRNRGDDTWTNITGATSASWTGTADTAALGREFRCTAGTAQSRAVRVFVTGAPVISSFSGSGGTLTGTTVGTVASWHWQKHTGTAWADFSTASGTAAATDPGRYRLVVQDGDGRQAVSHEISIT